jgi:hypothetical protein
VILTGYAATEAYRAACLGNGAELFLEKPKTSAAHETLFATLNELIKWQPEEGFRGVLRKVGLQDVLQMECLSRNSSVLEVKARRAQGRIFIRDGQIVHATLGEQKGDAAFNEMLAFRGGEFVLKSFTEPPERTLDGSWEFLLMEAARQRDELGQRPEGLPEENPDEDLPPGDEPALSARVESAPLTGTAQISAAGAAMAEEPLPHSGLLGVPLTDSTRLPTPPIDEVRVPSAGELSPIAAEGLLPRRLIEEVLVCSAQGEVLYEWQCRNSDLWVNFFEFLSQKSRRLAQGLVLGEFDRLEVASPEARLVAVISPRRGVLVRSRRETVPAATETGG